MRILGLFVIYLLLAINTAISGDLSLKRTENKSGVDFYKEEITLTVSDSEASVHGIYYFRNNTDRLGDFSVIFPFYVDSLNLFPYFIKPYLVDSAKTITLSFRTIENAGSISLGIPVRPRSVTIWYLDYVQRIKATHARYIITSTNAWGKPLEEATYRFIAPIDYDSIQTWPRGDSLFKIGGNFVITCHKKDFLPQQDMEISWIKK
jgi:hypothetical protein